MGPKRENEVLSLADILMLMLSAAAIPWAAWVTSSVYDIKSDLRILRESVEHASTKVNFPEHRGLECNRTHGLSREPSKSTAFAWLGR